MCFRPTERSARAGLPRCAVRQNAIHGRDRPMADIRRLPFAAAQVA